MFEGLARFIAYVSGFIQNIVDTVSSINPSQSIVLWIQIVSGLLTVTWIIFQFAWYRRLNEARLERYLEERIATERDQLAEERAETLAKLDLVAKRRGLRYSLLIMWANFRLAISFVLRMLSLGTLRGLADHTALLMQVGMLRRARRIYTEIAFDAMKKMKLYEGALSNKRVEAQNALIFAGRIAVLEDRPVAAVSSFKKAKRLQEDPDARLLIGKQLAIAEDFPGAEAEYQAALADPSIGDKPATRAEVHRSMAEIYMQRNRPGLARGQLALALELDGPLRDYLGLAKTEELLGDLYAPRPLNRNAAEQAYEGAIENFARAGDAQRARNVRGKLRKLRAEAEPIRDGWLTRLIDRCAQGLVKAVERRRGRPGRKED